MPLRSARVAPAQAREGRYRVTALKHSATAIIAIGWVMPMVESA